MALRDLSAGRFRFDASADIDAAMKGQVRDGKAQDMGENRDALKNRHGAKAVKGGRSMREIDRAMAGIDTGASQADLGMGYGS